MADTNKIPGYQISSLPSDLQAIARQVDAFGADDGADDGLGLGSVGDGADDGLGGTPVEASGPDGVLNGGDLGAIQALISEASGTQRQQLQALQAVIQDPTATAVVPGSNASSLMRAAINRSNDRNLRALTDDVYRQAQVDELVRLIYGMQYDGINGLNRTEEAAIRSIVTNVPPHLSDDLFAALQDDSLLANMRNSRWVDNSEVRQAVEAWVLEAQYSNPAFSLADRSALFRTADQPARGLLYASAPVTDETAMLEAAIRRGVAGADMSAFPEAMNWLDSLAELGPETAIRVLSEGGRFSPAIALGFLNGIDDATLMRLANESADGADDGLSGGDSVLANFLARANSAEVSEEVFGRVRQQFESGEPAPVLRALLALDASISRRDIDQAVASGRAPALTLLRRDRALLKELAAAGDEAVAEGLIQLVLGESNLVERGQSLVALLAPNGIGTEQLTALQQVMEHIRSEDPRQADALADALYNAGTLNAVIGQIVPVQLGSGDSRLQALAEHVSGEADLTRQGVTELQTLLDALGSRSGATRAIQEQFYAERNPGRFQSAFSDELERRAASALSATSGVYPEQSVLQYFSGYDMTPQEVEQLRARRENPYLTATERRAFALLLNGQASINTRRGSREIVRTVEALETIINDGHYRVDQQMLDTAVQYGQVGVGTLLELFDTYVPDRDADGDYILSNRDRVALGEMLERGLISGTELRSAVRQLATNTSRQPWEYGLRPVGVGGDDGSDDGLGDGSDDGIGDGSDDGLNFEQPRQPVGDGADDGL